MSRTGSLIALALAALLAAPTLAAPIFPEGAYPTLDANMKRHGRQFYTLNARPFGWSLDVHAADQNARDLIDQFLAQDASDDFETVTGSHPYEIIASYGEFGDLGFFGGVALAATAFEYLVLKRDGGTTEELERARERVVQAEEARHIFYVVTGGNGIVARGIRRYKGDEPGNPNIPMSIPDLMPLFDDNGDPLPQPKNNGEYREDNSGGVLPAGEWFWKDSCSKDQFTGQMLALVLLYEAMKDDPDIDQALVAQLQQDATDVAASLMVKRDITQWSGRLIGEGEYDLIIMDADGRPTKYHDLNPASLESIYLPSSFNRFNLLLAIGALEALFHVTGDPVIEEYLYKELLADRGFLEMVLDERKAIDYIYEGRATNIDNPDMTAVALFVALFVEPDAEVASVLRQYLETGLWDVEGEIFTARVAKQPLWHMVYMASTDQGVSQALVDETADLLEGFSLGPYWNDERINCDEQELEAMHCIAIDGATELTLIGNGERGGMLASEALHPRIRPPSNFDSRSHPFAVNGGGGMRLNPGGDMLGTYWMGRYLQHNAAGEVNLSAFARDHMPVGGGDADSDADTDVDTDTDSDTDSDADSDSGSGCNAAGGAAQDAAVLGLMAVLWLIRRRS